MENSERLATYLKIRVSLDQLVVVSEDNKLLTPAMRRRLRHKKNARKTHSHKDLPEYQPDRNYAYTKRTPCPKCHPMPKVKLIGG